MCITREFNLLFEMIHMSRHQRMYIKINCSSDSKMTHMRWCLSKYFSLYSKFWFDRYALRKYILFLENDTHAPSTAHVYHTRIQLTFWNDTHALPSAHVYQNKARLESKNDTHAPMSNQMFYLAFIMVAWYICSG